MLVSHTSILVSNNSDEEIMLKEMLCIYYAVYFQKKWIRALLDSNSKINTINSNFVWKLAFYIRKINVKAQKMDSSILKIFVIMIVNF